MTINTGGDDDDGLNRDLNGQRLADAVNVARGDDKDNGLNKSPNRKLDDGLNRDVNEQAGTMPSNLVEEIAHEIGNDV